MIPVYPRFNVTSFKILFIHETFFVFQFFFSLFFDDIPYLLEKLPQRKVTSNKIFRVFFIWGGGEGMASLASMLTYSYLDYIQHGVKEPIHIIILTKSIIPFFIHSFQVLTLVKPRTIIIQ